VSAVTQVPASAAADRNKQPLLQQLSLLLPEQALVLEIASGTGQHVAHFAAALPQTRWQPTDADPALLESIRLRCAHPPLINVMSPVPLDVHQSDWAVGREYDAVLALNLIHIAPWSATEALMAGAAAALSPHGPRLLVLYGPYLQAGVPTAASNLEFDHSLRSRNAQWGLRDLQAVTDAAARQGLRRLLVEQMPANNLLLAFAG
jgi:hypothetical protein